MVDFSSRNMSMERCFNVGDGLVSQIEQKTGTVTRGMRRREEYSVLCEIWQNRPRWLPEFCRCSYENKIGEVFPV